MPAETVYISGKGSWIRTTQTNDWGRWTATIHPDAESLEKVRELAAAGVKNTIKKDDDGYYVTYSRPMERTDRNGRKIGLTPVDVQLADGSRYDKLIGNGSDVTLKLEVYSHRVPQGGTAKAARLVAIRVDNLIPYDKEVDAIPGEKQVPKFTESKPKF